MARIEGLAAEKAGPITRVAYWLTRRKLGKMVEPVSVTAHHGRLMRAYGAMEQGIAASKTVPESLKALAGIKAAMQVGCPF